jgi:hypothetical protein
MTTNTKNLHPGARLWARLPRLARCAVAAPLAMALLGVEVTLRLSPKLDVLLTAAAFWVLWGWIGT